MNKKKELIFKMFDVYYKELTMKDNNLDNYMIFFDKNDKRKLLLNPFHGEYLLGYYKSDFKTLNSMNPNITKWFFEKYIAEWFANKYDVKINGVLLPLKNNY